MSFLITKQQGLTPFTIAKIFPAQQAKKLSTTAKGSILYKFFTKEGGSSYKWHQEIHMPDRKISIIRTGNASSDYPATILYHGVNNGSLFRISPVNHPLYAGELTLSKTEADEVEAAVIEIESLRKKMTEKERDFNQKIEKIWPKTANSFHDLWPRN